MTDEQRAKALARATLSKKIQYNASEEVLDEDVKGVFKLLTDLLLPAFFSDKPFSVCRARIVEAILTDKYADNQTVDRIIKLALINPSPFEFLKKLHSKLEKCEK